MNIFTFNNVAEDFLACNHQAMRYTMRVFRLEGYWFLHSWFYIFKLYAVVSCALWERTGSVNMFPEVHRTSQGIFPPVVWCLDWQRICFEQQLPFNDLQRWDFPISVLWLTEWLYDYWWSSGDIVGDFPEDRRLLLGCHSFSIINK